MDPEIQPLANKVNKIEQKLEEQEQRIDLLEHEEAAMEQKLAMQEIVNPLKLEPKPRPWPLSNTIQKHFGVAG